MTNKYTKLLISALEADGHSTTVFLRRQSYTTTRSRSGLEVRVNVLEVGGRYMPPYVSYS